MRQIVLDVETTGLDFNEGHRVIEIGAIEFVDRIATGEQFHEFINPQRTIDEAALKIHGITQSELEDKPLFADIAEKLVKFLSGSEVIAHNAPFDTGFLDNEFKLIGSDICIENICATVIDTLQMASRKHPGQRNNLDALCRRYQIDTTFRKNAHGALIDAQLLSRVYLKITGGQRDLFGQSVAQSPTEVFQENVFQRGIDIKPLLVIRFTKEEESAHQKYLDRLDKLSEKGAVARRGVTGESTVPQSTRQGSLLRNMGEPLAPCDHMRVE